MNTFTPGAATAAPPLDREDLVSQVARLAPLPAAAVERIRHEAVSASTGGVVEYGDYQSGGWRTAALMNHSGDAHDTVIGDGTPQPTWLLERMPATAELLDGLGLDYMFVRLARLEPNAYLWEHRDYAELADRPRYRLHIPVATNPSAVLVTAGARVHLSAGCVWRLTPTVPHGVCNELGPDRLHLIADVYANPAYERLAAAPHLADGDAVVLPELTRAERDTAVESAAVLAGLGLVREAEQVLLRLFYRHALPEGGVYDLVAELYAARGDEEAALRWRAAKDTLLARDTRGEATS